MNIRERAERIFQERKFRKALEREKLEKKLEKMQMWPLLKENIEVQLMHLP